MAGIRKHSRKRDAILEKLRSTASHPSAAWIYEQLRREIPDLSLGTVYRNLSSFKEEGLIASVGVVRGQERFDGNTEEHTHFICLHCGDVLDIDAGAGPYLKEKVEESYGLDIYAQQLTFYGRCVKCRDA